MLEQGDLGVLRMVRGNRDGSARCLLPRGTCFFVRWAAHRRILGACFLFKGDHRWGVVRREYVESPAFLRQFPV